MKRSFAVPASVALALAIMLPAFARDRSRNSAATVHSIGLLEAESQGLVGIKYIPNDARSAQVVVRNKSKKPLTLQLPAAFAGVPVVAQVGLPGVGLGGAGMGNPAVGGAGGGGATQAMGGGMGGIGMGGIGGMGGMGGGMFSLPPEAVRTLRVGTVCLEHGKPEPSTHHPYKMVPLDSYSDNPRLEIILERYGRGEMPQTVAQAATWHVANGLSWEQLAAEMIDHAGGFPDEPYFKPAELMAARAVVASASKAEEERKETSSAPMGW